ncbi:class 1a ribonucleoside-diphosphate reductase subunit alpha [Vibrio alginolyticus]|uniref:class 1a ribonucleoside-diphosphate reductase subunit alpha n=1 Tax=Vibrio alginolyticus TaxID=663 RepID=UPI0009BD40FC|nr:class 1a ribonucleoside-diphosphate reductase subunit alpha [Vibrio alginolyticus]CAH7159620.1 ribonucleoside-diphosphate reductase 1 subunit alpha [Vibrio chagasii]CAH7328891.1 ribonucleoside-diphosphate reductase 1 subunit alpha [Vibrio chagasii]
MTDSKTEGRNLKTEGFFAPEIEKPTTPIDQIRVLKRDGTREKIDWCKVAKVIRWASEGYNVSESQIELKSQIQFYDGIPTVEIHRIVVKAAADLISAEEPDYQFVAANLLMFHLRKVAYGEFTPPHLYEHTKKLVDAGMYDPELLELYTKEEFDEMNSMINHKLDFTFAYAAVKQFEGKYLTKNRVTQQVFDTPQMSYILIAASLHSRVAKEKRMDTIRAFYSETSNRRLSLPTPIMSGVRSKTRQFSSCVLIESGDSLDSINAAASSIVKYVSQRAGIGINAGALRGLGSEIRGGEAFHTGVIPFYKYFQTAVKCCSQGGVRGGAATVFYPFWHSEVQSLLVLKNNKGVEENRVRHMDYSPQFSRLAYKRLKDNGKITLFSPSDVPGLLDAFYADQDEFERLYVQYENDQIVMAKGTTTQISAIEFFTLFGMERSSTGRIYLQNIDHCNTFGSFLPDVAPIKQSNLCMEITLPTKPVINVDTNEGEVALCTLAGINLGELDINDLSSLEQTCMVAVRALDELIDYQDYPLLAAKEGTLARRSLGVGVINFAYMLAKNGLKYSDGSANNLTHRVFEAIQFYLIKASVELAKEKGPCKWFHETKYSKGILPIDCYKKEVDNYHTQELELDWEWLRGEILKHGMRNSTLSALMPSETSSQIYNATNGIEPPRGLVSVKASKNGILKQVVPEIETIGSQYELLWDIPNNQGYLTLVGLMQKFVDQSISANTNYDPERFESGKVSMTQILRDILFAYSIGVKTLYYHNTRDGATDDQTEPGTVVEQEDSDCEGGGCKI